MRLKLWVFLGILLMFTFASSSFAQMSGGDHDLSDTGSGTFADEVCVYCHTPHNALDNTVALWNRNNPSASSFTVYTSSTLNHGTTQTADNPGPFSLICLSCHDGSIALDSYGGQTGSTSMDSSLAAFIGTDLRDDHPVGVNYDAQLLTEDADFNAPGGIDLPLYSSKVECASCHDAHTSDDYFLRIDNTDSLLCLECHDK